MGRAVVFRTSGISTWVAQWKDGIKPASASPALPMAPSNRDGETRRDEDSEDEDEPEDDEGVGGVGLGSRGLVQSYNMNHVQRREFEKVRNGEVPNMYGNRKMSDVGFWSQAFIDRIGACFFLYCPFPRPPHSIIKKIHGANPTSCASHPHSVLA